MAGFGTRFPQVREAFVDFTAMPKVQRRRYGLPSSDAEFAELKGVSRSTLTKWKREPDFRKAVEVRRQRLAEDVLPNSVVAKVGRPETAQDPRTKVRLEREPVEVPVFPPDDPRGGQDYGAVEDQDEREYLLIKNRLVEMAAGGDRQAIDIYVKHWGRPFVEAELSDDLGLASMSDEELVAEFDRLMGGG